MTVMLATKEQIGQLHDRSARAKRADGRGLERMGVSEAAFIAWTTEDVLDTFATVWGGRRPDQPVTITAAELGAVMCTHMQVSFEAGYRLAEERLRG